MMFNLDFILPLRSLVKSCLFLAMKKSLEVPTYFLFNFQWNMSHLDELDMILRTQIRKNFQPQRNQLSGVDDVDEF